MDKTSTVSIREFVDSIEIVPLETNEHCLIKEIDKVRLFEDRIFVLDLQLQHLFCFDKNGRYLFTVLSKGPGPEEYYYTEDFIIDKYNKNILLLDPSGFLSITDFNGNFISKTRLPKDISVYNEIHQQDRDTFIFISSSAYFLAAWSKSDNKILYKREGEQVRRHVFFPFRKTYEYKGQLFYTPPVTNKTINLADSSIFAWNLGKYNNTENQIKNVKKLIMEGGYSREFASRNFVQEKRLNSDIFHNWETSRYRFFTVNLGLPDFKFGYVFYDKKTKKPYVFFKTEEGLQLVSSSVNMNGDKLVLVNDERFKLYDDKLLSDRQRKIIASRLDDDNPFLVIYHLKK
ncbi:MAG: 6-bladed beta-propeller [Dysgonamonadaceae bacterium]|nr:6-bladed beta-propeller [Dysgonamonadaceae bacterium]